MIKKGADLNLPRSNDNYTPFHTVIIGEEGKMHWILAFHCNSYNYEDL